MNIKEIETKTGLERATVRYYEEEGLLQPHRRPNGYRDYSQEDLATLQRIRFLRQLGLTLEEIGRVQRGETQLSEAMERRLAELVRQSEENQRRSAICRTLRDEGVTWQTLDAEKYEKALPQEKKKVYTPPERIPGHPWRRILARLLDVLISAVLPWAAFIAMFRAMLDAPATDGENVLLFFSVMVLALGTIVIEIFGEALALRVTGTTLGKWLMGISLEDRDGCRPDFAEARHRARRVYFPAFDQWADEWKHNNVYLYWQWFDRCERGEDLPWEEYQWLSVVYHELPLWKKIGYGVSLTGVCAALVVIVKCIFGA
ncbi:MAG: MerR family transcriptional regulator [Ruminococcaceae bacterium]|nr:MerR family transcriptional regulator [Oscillospiraceae bacterium]